MAGNGARMEVSAPAAAEQRQWRDWVDDGGDLAEADADDIGVSFASLGFLWAAVRRKAALVCTLAAAGLLAGFGALVKFPPAHQATASVLVANLPGQPAGSAVYDDQGIAQSHTVADAAARLLGLPPSAASSFATDYTATVATDEVLDITASATSSASAVRAANAVAQAFLVTQARLLRAQEHLANASLAAQITQAQQAINAISASIGRLSAQPASAATRAELGGLRSERSQATAALKVLAETNTSNEVATQVGTTTAIADSQVLDPAWPIRQHRKKELLLYLGGGLIGGLAGGLGIVLVGAVVSDRLRRRDDVARVLGAPVRLSVRGLGAPRLTACRVWTGKLTHWRRPGAPGPAIARHPDVRRIVAHLASLVPPPGHGPASLAVVPVDDIAIPAICVTELALSCAQQGLRVVVADLCSGAPAGRLLGATEPGVRSVRTRGMHLVVVIPAARDVLPAGPLRARLRAVAGQDELAAECNTADVLLTLASLDPAVGGDHLSGWTANVAAVITAGRSSAARINAVGEMIRLAAIASASAVLLGADAADESIGAVPQPNLPAMSRQTPAGRHANRAAVR